MRPILTDLRGNPIYSFGQPRLRRISHVHDIDLFWYVRNRAWETVLRRSKTHASEIELIDDNGNTPLHVACRLEPPADVVSALASTVRMRNKEGATPLHIAASHKCSAAAVQALLDAADRTSSCDDDNGDNTVTPITADLSRMGRAPIHYACMSFRGLELDAFRLLLDETLKHGNVTLNEHKTLDDLDEEFAELEDDDYYCAEDMQEAWPQEESQKSVNVMGMKDATGQTPLGLLFRRYRERVRGVISSVDRLRRENESQPDRAALAAAMTVHADLGDLWEKARWIVARLTEDRLQKEQDEEETLEAAADAKTNTGSDHRDEGPQSPGELAMAQEAAAWAVEQYQSTDVMEEEDILLLPLSDESAHLQVDSRATVQRARSLSEHGAANMMGAAHNPNANATTTTAMASQNRQFRIVHASVGLIGYGCPPEMIRLAISLHPHQVSEMDEDGNLPLHIAATAASHLAHAEQAASPSSLMAAAAATMAGGEGGGDDSTVISDAAMSFFSAATISQTTNPFDKVIKILLQHHPAAARIPQGRTGRLPLVCAVEAGRRTWADGIRTLLNAYPPALHNKKLMDVALYPNLLALVSSGQADASSNNVLCSTFGALLEDDRLLLAAPRRQTRAQKARLQVNARTTLFELMRAKPEWISNNAC